MIETNYFDNHCLTCRCELTDDNYTKEHIFPKWLQKKFNIGNSKLYLTNKTSIPYNQLLVPCCKDCNGIKMSQCENTIKQGIEAGYEEFIKIDKNIIVWWLAKIYYSNLVKETQLKKDIKDPNSPPIIHQSFMKHFNILYRLMGEFINSPNYDNNPPYEIYIFKSDDKCFDYMDSLYSNTCMIQIDNIIIVCSFDTFNLCGPFYKKDIAYLEGKKEVKAVQAAELFVKFQFYKKHFDYSFIAINGGDKITYITSFNQIKEFSLLELHYSLIYIYDRYGIRINNPDYREGQIVTLLSDNAFN